MGAIFLGCALDVRTHCIKKKNWNCKFSKHGKKTKNCHLSLFFAIRFRAPTNKYGCGNKTLVISSRSKKKLYFFSSVKTKYHILFSRFVIGNAKKRKKFVICSRWNIFTEIAKKIKIQAETQKNAKLQNMFSMKIFFLANVLLALIKSYLFKVANKI